jgi:hypothetical protein
MSDSVSMPFVCSPSGLRELLFGGIFVSTRRASIIPIVAQSHELWVPKTTLGRPFQRLNRRDRFKARSNGKHAAGKIALGNQAAAQQDMNPSSNCFGHSAGSEELLPLLERRRELLSRKVSILCWPTAGSLSHPNFDRYFGGTSGEQKTLATLSKCIAVHLLWKQSGGGCDGSSSDSQPNQTRHRGGRRESQLRHPLRYLNANRSNAERSTFYRRASWTKLDFLRVSSAVAHTPSQNQASVTDKYQLSPTQTGPSSALPQPSTGLNGLPSSRCLLSTLSLARGIGFAATCTDVGLAPEDQYLLSLGGNASAVGNRSTGPVSGSRLQVFSVAAG